MSKKNKKKAKQEKKKVVYIDDNSTIADMSGTKRPVKKGKSTFKEKAKTYFSTVRQMLIPMFITLAAFTLVYLIFILLAKII
jgi:hypothetical protein